MLSPSQQIQVIQGLVASLASRRQMLNQRALARLPGAREDNYGELAQGLFEARRQQAGNEPARQSIHVVNDNHSRPE
jgi:hypothetical protein